MQNISTNYGLLGGQLDCTKHLERGILRLTSGEERRMAIAQLAELTPDSKRIKAQAKIETN